MKTDKLLHLLQQKKFMRSGGALPLPKAQDAGSIDFRLGPTVTKANAFAQQNIVPAMLPNTARPYIDFPDNRVTDPVVKGKLLESTRKAPLYNIPREDINKIVEQAFAVGVDPATLITIIANETKFGKTDENIGHSLNHRTPTVEGLDEYSLQANLAAQALKEQLRLGKGRYPNGPSYKQLQSYQGYGALTPSTEKDYYGHNNSAFFGIPVTKEKPLLTNKVFPYGKTIEQYRDSVIIPALDKYGINYKQDGGLAKAQSGLEKPTLKWMPQALKEMNSNVTNSLGNVISTPESRAKDNRANYLKNNPAKYTSQDYIAGHKEEGLDNSVFSDPIAMAAALTAGGVGLGAYGVSQVPRMFLSNLASEATAGLTDVGKYLTRNTALKNAYKINPWAFKPNPESYYRMIGDEGLADLQKVGHVRSNPNTFYADKHPFFSKGYPIDGRIGKSVVEDSKYLGNNMIEVGGNNEIGNRFVKNRWADAAPDSNIFVARDKIGIDNPNLKIFEKHWLQGYKQVEVPKQEDGGEIIKDDDGYWNPNNWGKVVEIGSNDITMEGVDQPLLGVSDIGDTKLMKPGKNYKFKGKKVTEYPMAKNGLRQEQKGLQNLDNLLNFTNYNKPQPGSWLEKYN